MQSKISHSLTRHFPTPDVRMFMLSGLRNRSVNIKAASYQAKLRRCVECNWWATGHKTRLARHRQQHSTVSAGEYLQKSSRMYVQVGVRVIGQVGGEGSRRVS